MRMSYNGCRVLRKGCDDDCIIKPCLQWIKSLKSQTNATLFLAKFYGRTDLFNLINVVPEHLRPRFLDRCFMRLVEGPLIRFTAPSACCVLRAGISLCQAAVEAVLRGDEIHIAAQASSSELAIKGCEIRHVLKDASSSASDVLRKVKSKSKRQFKKSAPKTKPKAVPAFYFLNELADDKSMVSWQPSLSSDRGGERSSVETVEASMAKLDDDLELTIWASSN